MTIAVGNRLPATELLKVGDNGVENVPLGQLLAHRKVIVFTVTGAYTSNCTGIHIPGYIDAMNELTAKGIEDVICIAVNDPFVMSAWGDATGGQEAGITFLADPSGQFAQSVGKAFDYEPHGMFNRCGRFAALVEDGVVTHLREDEPGQCSASVAAEMLRIL